MGSIVKSFFTKTILNIISNTTVLLTGNNMKILIILLLATVICTTYVHAFPLQGFGTGDQTTGSVWPPYPNAGQGYWSSKPLNIGIQKVYKPVPELNLLITQGR